MKTEQQRIAIAEACGWSLDYIKHHAMYYVPYKDIHIGDPINDLNAMHEAEGELNRGSGYHETGGYGLYLVALDHDVSATAAQRAEAFLRTIGKWVES